MSLGANVCGIVDIQNAVWQVITGARQELDAALKLEDSEVEMGHILDYYTNNPEREQFPVIMMQPSSDEFEWFSMPTSADQVSMIEVWGFVHHDNERTRMRLLGRMAAAIASAVNRRHLPISVEGGFEIYFNQKVPIARINYGVYKFPNALVGAFVATFVCDVTVSLPDAIPQSP